MTGNVALLGFASAGTPGLSVLRSTLALVAFIGGAVIGGRMSNTNMFPTGRARLAAATGIEAAMLLTATAIATGCHLSSGNSPELLLLIILSDGAMGIRNTTIRALGVPDLTTTVLALTITGLAADSSLATGSNASWPRRLGSVLFLFVGAATGALLLQHSLMLPLATASLILGFSALSIALGPNRRFKTGRAVAHRAGILRAGILSLLSNRRCILQTTGIVPAIQKECEGRRALVERMIVRLERLGITLLRIALVIVLCWIGRLKFADYEAEGIAPLVASSPLMSLFYKYPAPEYRKYINREGEVIPAHHQWHEDNRTYSVSHGLRYAIILIGFLITLHPLFPQVAALGCALLIFMSLTTLSFLVTTSEAWVPPLSDTAHGFPYLSVSGRLIVKDVIMLRAAIVTLADSARAQLRASVR